MGRSIDELKREIAAAHHEVYQYANMLEMAEQRAVSLQAELAAEKARADEDFDSCERVKRKWEATCAELKNMTRHRDALQKSLWESDNQLAAANQEIHRFVTECARCGSHGQKAEHTNYCPECLAWYREEWGQHSPCAKESILAEELEAKNREIASLTDKLIAAGNAKADAKEALWELTGVDSGSVEAEARDMIQQVGYAETLRRVGDCGKWSLSWESVNHILELLQEGIISRRKAHESLNAILHGETVSLPPLENCAFDDVELPGETVRQLRRLVFKLSNDCDMAKGTLEAARGDMAVVTRQRDEFAAALYCSPMPSMIDNDAPFSENANLTLTWPKQRVYEWWDAREECSKAASAIIARVRREAKAEVLDFIADVDDAAIAKMDGPRAAAQVLREYAAAIRRGEKGPAE